MTDDILQEIALRGGRGDFVLPGKMFRGKNARYLKLGVFVPTNDHYRTIPCPNGCPDDAFVYRTGNGFFAVCNHGERTERIDVDPDEVMLFMFDEVTFRESKLELPQAENASGDKVYPFIISCDDATHTVTMRVFNGKGKSVTFPFKIAGDTCWSVVRQFADAESSPVVLKKPRGRKTLNLKSIFRKTKGDNRDLFYKYIYTVKIGSRAAYELRQVPKK